MEENKNEENILSYKLDYYPELTENGIENTYKKIQNIKNKESIYIRVLTR